MVTGIIVGAVLGFLLGWFASRRLYEKHLKTANERLRQGAEALGTANAITSAQTIKLHALQLENNQLKVRLERAVVPIGEGDTFSA